MHDPTNHNLATRTSSEAPTDHSLILRTLAGDPEARQELGGHLDRMRNTIRSCDRRMGGRLAPDLLEDVAQEARLAVWSKLDQFEPGRSLGAWIHGFAVRQHMRAVRSQARGSVIALTNEIESPQPPPSLEPDETSRLVRRGLAVLPGPESSVIHQHHYPGHSFGEIASCSGTPYGTVKTRYYRGLRKLQSWLVAQDPELGAPTDLD